MLSMTFALTVAVTWTETVSGRRPAKGVSCGLAYRAAVATCAVLVCDVLRHPVCYLRVLCAVL